MSRIWESWFYWNLDMLLRHIGTAGLASVAALYMDGKWGWKAFGVGILTGAVLPTVFTILQRGLPKRPELGPDPNNEVK